MYHRRRFVPVASSHFEVLRQRDPTRFVIDILAIKNKDTNEDRINIKNK